MNWAERLLCLIGLALLGAVAAAGVCVSLLPASYSYGGVGPWPLSMIVNQLAAELGGPLVTVGLSSLAGLAFLRAAHWHPPTGD